MGKFQKGSKGDEIFKEAEQSFPRARMSLSLFALWRSVGLLCICATILPIQYDCFIKYKKPALIYKYILIMGIHIYKL